MTFHSETSRLAIRTQQAANEAQELLSHQALIAAAAELRRLDELINSPHTAEFLESVKLEAIHQRERWGTVHDNRKTDADWYWLVGYLAGKALHKPEKTVHHIITTAAALMNWHTAKTESAKAEPCSHPWHSNPALITPCPACNAGEEPSSDITPSPELLAMCADPEWAASTIAEQQAKKKLWREVVGCRLLKDFGYCGACAAEFASTKTCPFEA